MRTLDRRPFLRRPWQLTVAGLAVLCLGLAACASSSGGSSAGGGSASTIKVGQITTISGGYPFGDTVKGTQSYFNMVNAHGGVNGHKITLVSGDDKGQPSQAASLARQFALQDHVVAMVGNTSLIDCITNKGFYQAEHIGVIGGGTQPLCFSQPNWDPVNAGPYVGHVVLWDYMFNVLRPSSVCEIEQNDSSSIAPYNALRAWYEQGHPGVKTHFTQITYTNDATVNPTPAVTAAKQKGCDMIELSTVAPNAVAFIKAAKSVGYNGSFICLGSCYDASVPGTLGSLGEPGALGPKDKGFFVGAELAKVDSSNPNVQQMVQQFKADGTPANFWSEIGWVSGMVFVKGLEQKKGADVTTSAGVLAALKAMHPVNTGFAATPLTFGPGSAHSPNKGSQMILIKGGKWVIAPNQNAGQFMTVPPLPTLPS
jgi:branched-chain amino acid transport system substrate-binding protein